MAEVATALYDDSARQAERHFGWRRETVAKGLQEARSGMRCLEDSAARGRRRSGDRDPEPSADIRAVVGPHTYADLELRPERRYTNLTAAEVRETLQQRGYPKAVLPGERMMRDIVNRMNYRLKRIQKGKPLKQTRETDAVFANVRQLRDEVKGDGETLEISMDTKAKVNPGDYVRGGKTRTDCAGNVSEQGVGP
jgi:hypothetical protein